MEAQQFLVSNEPYASQIKTWIVDELHLKVEDVVDVTIDVHWQSPYYSIFKHVILSVTFADGKQYQNTFTEKVNND
jgi:hypothetical protein